MEEQESVMVSSIEGSVGDGETITTTNADGDMVQYVIYSGEGEGPIGMEELRDALSKLTGQQVAFNEAEAVKEPPTPLQSEDIPGELSTVTQAALSQDSDLNFRLSAESMVGEVSFVDDNVVVKGNVKKGHKADINYSTQATDYGSSRLVIDDNTSVPINQLLQRQRSVVQVPAQITIETEFGPITLETNKLTPGQLDGSEQITVNVLTQDANGESTQQRALKLQPGMIAKAAAAAAATPQEIRLAGFPDTVNDETIQGSDFASVLQQLTDLCSEQIPLPVQVGQINQAQEIAVNETDSAASVLEDYINLKFPDTPKRAGQKAPIEVSKLESYLKNKYSGARFQIQSAPTLPTKVTVDALKICCAAHSELKNQAIRRKMLPIPLNVTKCPECTLDLGNRKSLRLHIQRYHVPDFKHVCENRIKIRQMQKPEMVLTDAPIIVDSSHFLDDDINKKKHLSCAVCEEMFITQRDYLHHIYQHGKKVVHCTACKKQFTTMSALTAHVDYVHNGKTQYQCRQCAQKFRSLLSWREHERLHKSPLSGTIRCLLCKCSISQQKFRKHMHLLHKITHKPKQDCGYCGERFKSADYLARHTRKFHNFEKNEHLCPMCYKAFPTIEERDGHILSYHTDQEMMECDIIFNTEPKDCHQRQCSRCGKIYSTYARLKKHYDKHENEKTQCLLCGQEYHWIANLDQHYKREHSIEDLVKFGIPTPTLNLLRHDQGFELVGKPGRKYASRFDLVGQTEDPEDICGKITVMDFQSQPAYQSSHRSSYRLQHPNCSQLDYIRDEDNDSGSVIIRQNPPKRNQTSNPRQPRRPVVKNSENSRTIVVHPNDLGINPDEVHESGMLLKRVQETITAARNAQIKRMTPKSGRAFQRTDPEHRTSDGRMTSPAIQKATALARKVLAAKQNVEIVINEETDVVDKVADDSSLLVEGTSSTNGETSAAKPGSSVPRRVNNTPIRKAIPAKEPTPEERRQQQEALKIDEDVDKIKAPRYLDIVSNRMNTVINLARVWSRRERKLYYMKDEEVRLRRAAATIPKKRVGNEWEEMPLFLDGVSGKLVTVEGMADLWRERAQVFLDSLGKGQLILDFLPLYDLGQQNKEKIAQTISTISGFAAKATVKPVEKPVGVFKGRSVSNDKIDMEEKVLKGDTKGKITGVEPKVTDQSLIQKIPKDKVMQPTNVEKMPNKKTPKKAKVMPTKELASKEKTTRILPTTSKSGRKLKYTERGRKFKKHGDVDTSEDEEEEIEEEEIEEEEIEEGEEEEEEEELELELEVEEVEEEEEEEKEVQSPQQEPPVKRRPGRPRSSPVAKPVAKPEPKPEPKSRKVFQDGVALPNISKAKMALKARAKGTRSTRVRPEAFETQRKTVKGKRGRPPGFNPDRDSPFPKKPRLTLTNIRDIIGDAKKIIVQMESESPKRTWKKQTARKSFIRPRPDARKPKEEKKKNESDTDSRVSSRSGRSGSRRNTRDSGKDQDKNSSVDVRKSASRKSASSDLDMIDGPPRRGRSTGSDRDSDKSSDQQPSDKGSDSGKTSSKRSAASSKKDVTITDKKSNDTGPPSKRTKTDSPTKSTSSPSLVSPRSAVLTPSRSAAFKQRGVTSPSTDAKKKLDDKPPVKAKTLDSKNMSSKKDASKETSKRTKATTKSNATDSKKSKKSTETKTKDDSPSMPELEVEVSSQEYVVPEDESPLLSVELSDNNINNATITVVTNDRNVIDDETEPGFIAYVKKSMRMVFHGGDADSIKLVGTALTPSKTCEVEPVDSWDVLVGSSPTKSPAPVTSTNEHS